ncbi:MAG: SMI1/KNR4 family protein [Rhizobium sp.]
MNDILFWDFRETSFKFENRQRGCQEGMLMESLIAEAKRVYDAAGLNCGHRLLPPVSKDAIDQIALELSLPIPDELRAVYAVHGGQQYIPPGVTGLFGEHRLHSPAEVIENHKIHAENYYIVFDPPPTFPPSGEDDPGVLGS